MKLVIIIGPHAVGKMTVGQELAKETGLKLFHNHMTIDPISELFSSSPQEFDRLKELFRHEIFDAFSKTDEYGMIFTFMWRFDCPEDEDYIENIEKLFLERGAEVYFVELSADFDLRIERNKTENRLLNKSTKRNIVQSEKFFRETENKYRLNSIDGEIKKENYLRINNSNLSPQKVATMIKEKFEL
ncbi:AAA family ATPase [Enterococcus timonensis]|uniref:AAA family ATPase n=1 Tax=Enterococcus timonensis TaxID=1852364 RepID=UPI0008D959E4|nr:AAA family ATPase [Enterococcus timonensis]